MNIQLFEELELYLFVKAGTKITISHVLDFERKNRRNPLLLTNCTQTFPV
jgi:hypothetical protein